jgi:hypothetical protein
MMYSCNNMNVSVCIPNINPDSLKTQMLPLSVGNYWVYEDSNISGGKDTVKFEITGLQNIYYYKLGNKRKMMGYRIKQSSSKPNLSRIAFYYVKCESQTQLVYSEEDDPNNITGFSDVLSENPETAQIDTSNQYIRFEGTENIDTRFGNLQCYVMEKIPHSKKELITSHNRSYYHKGIGLVKVHFLSQDKIFSERNLIKYAVKK